MNDRPFPRVRAAEFVGGFIVRLMFTDGVVRDVDLAPLLRGPVFEGLKEDPQMFRQMRVDSELGTIVWPNGADIDPDVLYGSAMPAWTERHARSGGDDR